MFDLTIKTFQSEPLWMEESPKAKYQGAAELQPQHLPVPPPQTQG